MDRAGVAGPVFISVAPRETAAEKMNKFLDINPMVPRERRFVDDSPTFAAYASAGFKNIGEDQKTSLADATKLTAPRLSAGAWWRYLTNVASLSPVPDGLKFGEVPEGVLRCVTAESQNLVSWPNPWQVGTTQCEMRPRATIDGDRFSLRAATFCFVCADGIDESYEGEFLDSLVEEGVWVPTRPRTL